jgi:ribosomal protein L9
MARGRFRTGSYATSHYQRKSTSLAMQLHYGADHFGNVIKRDIINMVAANEATVKRVQCALQLGNVSEL